MDELLVGLGFFALIALLIVGFVWFVSRKDPLQRQLRQARRTFVADVRPGEVVLLVGRLLPAGELLQAPLSGEPCLACVARIENDFNPDDPDATVSGVQGSRLPPALWLEDESGRVLLRLDHQPQPDVQYTYPQAIKLRELSMSVVDRFLAEQGATYDDLEQGFPFGVAYAALPADFRGVEWRLQEGERVAVLGRASLEPFAGAIVPSSLAPSGGYRAAPQALVIGPDTTLPLRIFLGEKEIERESRARRHRTSNSSQVE